MGRLVQQPAPARADRKYPADRSRGKLLPGSGSTSHGRFLYDAARDAYACLGQKVLSARYESKSRDNVKIDQSNRDACKACHLRERCTKTFRRASRLENEAVRDRMAARLSARPDILDRRQETVEHPFSTIKQWMNQGAFLMRRLDSVRGEFSLPALAYNIKRAVTLVSVTSLIAAVRV